MNFSVDQMLQKAIEAHRTGKVEEAERLYRSILQEQENHPHANHNLGLLAAGVGKPELSLPYFKVALEANPKQAQYWLSMIYTLIKVGQIDNARKVLQQGREIGLKGEKIDQLAKQLEPEDVAPTSPHPKGVPEKDQMEVLTRLFNQGRFEEVIKQVNALVEQFPKVFTLFNILGAANASVCRLDAAIQSYRRALQIKPDYVEAHNNLGNALQEKGDLTASIESFNRAIQIKPDYAEAHYNLGNALQEGGDLTAAIESLNRALQIKPDFAEAYSNLGSILQDKGDLTAARESYSRALRIKPDFAECYRNYSTVTKYKQGDPFIPKMRKLISANDISENDIMHLCFPLAKAEHDFGNLELSIKHLIQGNALRKKNLAYDISQDEKLFSAIKNFFSTSVANKPADFVFNLSTMPIFILGMPRSGTTLIEQIISSHSDVFGAGELDFLSQAISSSRWSVEKDHQQVLSTIRTFYNQKLSKVSGANFITDKMPLNFRWIGFIVDALPEAKIIHLKRDAAAVCWSNFKTYFESEGMAFTFDVQDIAKYYRLYEDLMDFWYRKYPRKIYNLHYEKLTESQEEETRKLFDYLELDWEDNVLDFHNNERSVLTASNTQVRQKMYTGSSLEWKKYEQWLQPMLEILDM